MFNLLHPNKMIKIHEQNIGGIIFVLNRKSLVTPNEISSTLTNLESLHSSKRMTKEKFRKNLKYAKCVSFTKLRALYDAKTILST